MRDIAAEVRQVSSSSEPVSRSVWAPMVGVPVVEVGDVRMCVRLRVVVVRVRMSWNDRLVDPVVMVLVMVIVMVIVMVVVLVGVVHRLVTVDVEVVGPERERDTGAGSVPDRSHGEGSEHGPDVEPGPSAEGDAEREVHGAGDRTLQEGDVLR